MKKNLLVLMTISIIDSSAMAQSAFEGFYGQLATGYESNSVSGISAPLILGDSSGSRLIGTASSANQNFGGVPLVAGLGYNFSVAPNWLVGIGADYSFLSQESQSYDYSLSDSGVLPAGTSFTGAKIKTSNRYSLFIMPSYLISSDKLVYLKAGYSSVKVDVTAPNYAAINGDALPLAGVVSDYSKTLNGYVVGLGYKQIINGGIYGFGELNYMNYGSANFGRTSSSGSGSGLTTVSTNTNTSINSYQLLVGIGYKF